MVNDVDVSSTLGTGDNITCGSVVLIVTARPPDAPLVLPPASVAFAVMVWSPSLKAELVIDQLPPVAVALPKEVVPLVS